MAFSENLQFLRAQNSITQEQFAEQLNVSRQSVSKWESGASFPEMDTLLRIGDVSSVTLATRLRGDLAAASVADTARYDAFMNRFALRISLSVAAIIAGVALMTALNANHFSDSFDILSVALFMLILTVSVVVMVASGIEEDHFRKKHPVIQDFYTEEEKDAFHQKFVWYISGGVGANLEGAGRISGVCGCGPVREPWVWLAGSAFLLLIAGAVFCFIYGGMQADKYKIWKYNRDNNPTPEAKKQLNLIGAACGAIMLAATAIYVALGLTRGAWGTAQWLYVVGGIGCGIVSVLLDPYKGEDD